MTGTIDRLAAEISGDDHMVYVPSSDMRRIVRVVRAAKDLIGHVEGKNTWDELREALKELEKLT